MARKISTTVRLDPEDVEALARARKEGISTSELIRKGLRIAGSRYYKNRRPPSIGLFVSTDVKLGDESEMLGLGLVDGLVAAVAERRRVYRILTTDHADFVPLRVGPRYRQALTLVPDPGGSCSISWTSSAH